ncbi:MAG TPA: DUF3857 domain-containing protein [Thermoanaerobaculia bacterium]
MVRFLRITAVLLLCLFATSLFPAALFAREPWDGTPFAAEPKTLVAAAEKIDAGEAAAIVLLNAVTHTFDAEGRSVTTEHHVYRIVDESAIESWSTVEAGWAPWYQERPVIQARVVTKDGTVHQLDPNALTEAPAPEESLDIFSDNRVIRAPLPAVAVGSIIEQVVTYKQKSAFFEAGTTSLFYFGDYVPVHRARLVIDAPASLPLKFVNTTELKEQTEGQRRTFEGGPYAAIEHVEWNLPYDVAQRPYIAFSTGASWQEIARRYAKIVDEQIAASPVDAHVRDAIGGTKERREAVAKALAWIQKRVRYAGVEVGESSIVPRAPKTVLQNRYGDCKDKATLLVALLRGAGLDAHVALLRAGEDFDTPRSLPGLGMFNHAIVVVGDDLWVDPTDEFARAGELPSMDQGRLALVASATTTDLVMTPVSESKANRTVETRIFTLPEEGKAAVREITEPTGIEEASMRRDYATSDRKSYRESMEGYAKGYYLAKELKTLEASDAHDLAKPFRLELGVSEATRGMTAGGDAVVAVFTSGLLETLPWPLRNYEDDEEEDEDHRPRTNDFVFTRPYVKEWRYQIAAPAGFVARTLPQNETTPVGSATLSRELALQPDGSVVATFRFDSGKRRLNAAEFTAMRKAVAEIQAQPALMIGFDEIGRAKLNAGDVAGALAEFRKMAALHPKEARHQADIAEALLIGGMGEAAREQIKRAIALEPGYAGAYRTQGYILQHDVLGRPFRQGFDRKGMIAAYRKAKELDADDIYTRRNLAKLLTYGDDGVPFGRNAELDAAITEYRETIAKDKQSGAEHDLLVALARAKRFDELKEFAKTLENAQERDLALVIVAAATESTEAALRIAGTRDHAARKKLLADASPILLALRLYTRSADLLDEATKDTPALEQRAYLDVLRKSRRYEELDWSEADAKSYIRKVVRDGLLGIDMKEHYHADLQPQLAREAVKAQHRAAYRMLLGAARAQGFPPGFYVDIGVASFTAQQEGDDDTGYRVRVRSTVQATKGEQEAMFVVREAGVWRVSGSTDEPATLGMTVLRLLDAKRPEAARQWLNWAREDFASAGGDDPLAGMPFTKVWAKATQTATEDEMRVAAATLMLDEDSGVRSIPILTVARQTATGERQQRLDQALATAYVSAKRWNDALTVAQRLYAALPQSDAAFDTVIMMLAQLGRLDDAAKLANERLARLPKDEAALRALASTAMHQGNYAESEKVYRQIIDEMTPNDGDYNNIAWNALLSGTNLERALEDAGHARSGAAGLHTLASIYAETGKTLEARAALLKSMDDAGRDEPSPSDWYVLGRIAENYGATEAALAAYKKVEKPAVAGDKGSTYVLAERRIKALGKR